MLSEIYLMCFTILLNPYQPPFTLITLVYFTLFYHPLQTFDICEVNFSTLSILANFITFSDMLSLLKSFNFAAEDTTATTTTYANTRWKGWLGWPFDSFQHSNCSVFNNSEQEFGKRKMADLDFNFFFKNPKYPLGNPLFCLEKNVRK